MRIPTLSIVGLSGSGKTTLLVKLVRRLSRKGYRIGTVKHCGCRFETDRPGKDSYRHFQAGSCAAAIVSAGKLAFVRRLRRPLRLVDIVEAHYRDVDLVLAEGFKREAGPKLEVVRRAIARRPVCPPRGGGLVALVADDPVEGYPQPRFRPSQVAEIARFIEATCLTRRPSRPQDTVS